MEHTTIDLRKTFARVVYFIEQLEAGKTKTAILQEVKKDIKVLEDNIKASDRTPRKSNCSPY